MISCRPVPLVLVALFSSLPLFAGDLEERLAQASREHPRLLATSGDFARVRQRIEEDARMKRVWQEVWKKADRALKQEPLERIQTGRRLLGVSREALDRIIALGMAYHVTGEEKYLERAKKTLTAVSEFSDWNPPHFLDVAEATAAMAIGYDWFHQDLTPALRKQVRDAIIGKGLEPSFKGRQWWVKGTNNWNQVCHGGMILGALAILEDDPEWAQRVVARAIEGVPHAMKASYNPTGTYPEGPGYWTYGTSYNVILLAVLQEVLGSDFGLTSQPGFARTGDAINHMVGASGETFNFADGGASEFPAPAALFWLARHFERPDWVTARLDVFDFHLEKAAGRRLFPLTLLWAPPLDEKAEVKMALDWKGDGEKPVTMHRNGWGEWDGTYLGVCAGTPHSNHGHMDIGSFVFESQGVRWVDDLGSQSYHSLERLGLSLWDRRQNGERWTVFRLNNFSHNTLTIDGQLQRVDGFAPIKAFSDDKDSPYTAVDMSPVYQGQAKEVVRTFHLPKKSYLVVRDRIEGVTDNKTVTWRMMTGAKIRLASPREAWLTLHSHQLQVRLLEPANARWVVRDATKPVASHDYPNAGKSILEFTVPAPDDGILSTLVVMDPAGGPTLLNEAARKLKAF